MTDSVDLPKGWAWTTLDQFTQGRGQSVDPSRHKSEEFELYSIPGFDANFPEYVKGERIGSAKQLVRTGSVLLSKINPRINRVWLVGDDCGLRKIASTEWIVFPKSECINSKYLQYFLRQDCIRNFLAANVSGVGGSLMRIKASTLDGYPLPLAPLTEQNHIVEKIETLFTELDEGEESLRKVQTLLARYRQSVLKAAVTGELTADWRTERAGQLEHGRDLLARILKARRENWQGRGKYSEPLEPDTSDLPKLPQGWIWVSVSQIAHVIGGLTKNGKRSSMPLRRPMLRVANVYQNRLDLSEVHEIGVTESELERVLLNPLDLLVVEGNGSKDQIGRMALWRGEIPNAVHQNHLIKVRLVEKGLVEFLLWWFQSPNGRQMIEKVASSTSGLYTLSIRKIESLIAPVPSVEEAQEITCKVQEAFARIDQLQAYTETELWRSAALRQSILKDAFAGKLVPQDWNDEPASELLARIRTQRQTESRKTTRRMATA